MVQEASGEAMVALAGTQGVCQGLRYSRPFIVAQCAIGAGIEVREDLVKSNTSGDYRPEHL